MNSKGWLPIQKSKEVRIQAAFLIKEIFSSIGFLFILLFTARGILQIVSAVLAGKQDEAALLNTLKQSHSPTLDAVLLVFCILIVIHGILGVFYAIKTDYGFKGLFRKKVLFYLQIISAVGAFFVVYLLIRRSGNAEVHSIFSWVTAALISLLGAFHFANGFSNACVTLGISVSERSKTIATILSWLIAVISILQIAVWFL